MTSTIVRVLYRTVKLTKSRLPVSPCFCAYNVSSHPPLTMSSNSSMNRLFSTSKSSIENKQADQEDLKISDSCVKVGS
ncbi:hypothetical protein PoB_005446300 [Plakobranchus ocellatus]|uniref:Uncharacterized protein n=1 Tax=Plakobranchus ocellatus TaxID=259542 RepID=A0AAV4CAE9_9GAST|nr:hypothetical protein PoB_005446300 [Plakobranchus ocellatus]